MKCKMINAIYIVGGQQAKRDHHRTRATADRFDFGSSAFCGCHQ